MTAPLLTSRVYMNAEAYAKLRLATRYAAMSHGASGYERSPVYLNADAYRFSRPVSTTCSEGDL